MRDASISSFRIALRRQGVWGSRAQRLLQEWTDHVRETAEQRVKEGADPVAAEAAAWRALGNPKDLALHAAGQLAAGSWSGRHPWLAGLVLPVLVWVATFGMLFFWGAWCAGVFTHPEQVNITLLKGAALMFNWLPWLVSAAWLCWMAARMPGGWKLFWITALVLAFCSTALELHVTPPRNGSCSGSWTVTPLGLGRLLLSAIGWIYAKQSLLDGRGLFSGVTQWAQALLLLTGAVSVRLQACRKVNIEGQLQSSAPREPYLG